MKGAGRLRVLMPEKRGAIENLQYAYFFPVALAESKSLPRLKYYGFKN